METKKEEQIIDFTMNEENLNEVIYIKDEQGNVIDVVKKQKPSTYINEETKIQFLND